VDDDETGRLTIGALARRTGMPVRTIRYWSDIGVLPPVARSGGGYRLYDGAAVARLELIATLRELGFGLAEVRRVLEARTTVAAVAAVHVDALDVQLRAIRLRRAVLSTVAKRQSPLEEMTFMNKLARLSADQRRQLIEDFVDDIVGTLDADPQLREQWRRVSGDLPDDPTPEQVDAWVELADLVADPGFRAHLRQVAEANAAGRAQPGPGQEPGAYQWFARKLGWQVGEARRGGIAPEDPAAAEVLTRLLGDDPARRTAVLERLSSGIDERTERYRELLARINGTPATPSQIPDQTWLLAALRAHR
jgi:DNA-binding transcriptional MerR regulator